MKFVRPFVLALLFSLTTLVSVASASTIWVFNNTVLQGSVWNPTTQTSTPVTETVTGSFTVNTAVTALLSFNVNVSGNWAQFNHLYDSTVSGNASTFPAIAGPANNFALTFWAGNIYLSIELVAPLFETAAPAQILLSLNSGFNAMGDGTYTCYGPCASLTSVGYVSTTGTSRAGTDAVPEPATLALVGIGAVLAASRLRRRK